MLEGLVLELGAGELFVQAFEAVIPKVSFETAEAALRPLGGGQGIDERELVGAGGMEIEEEGRGDGFELGGIFEADGFAPGVDAGFEAVEAVDGFAFGRSGAVGFFGIEAIGVWRRLDRHD